eukprot:6175405-Pleurochrysis_carterae.AAC.2
MIDTDTHTNLVALGPGDQRRPHHARCCRNRERSVAVSEATEGLKAPRRAELASWELARQVQRERVFTQLSPSPLFFIYKILLDSACTLSANWAENQKRSCLAATIVQ